jgi:hypothetical protein
VFKAGLKADLAVASPPLLGPEEAAEAHQASVVSDRGTPKHSALLVLEDGRAFHGLVARERLVVPGTRP